MRKLMILKIHLYAEMEGIQDNNVYAITCVLITLFMKNLCESINSVRHVA